MIIFEIVIRLGVTRSKYGEKIPVKDNKIINYPITLSARANQNRSRCFRNFL